MKQYKVWNEKQGIPKSMPHIITIDDDEDIEKIIMKGWKYEEIVE